MLHFLQGLGSLATQCIDGPSSRSRPSPRSSSVGASCGPRRISGSPHRRSPRRSAASKRSLSGRCGHRREAGPGGLVDDPLPEDLVTGGAGLKRRPEGRHHGRAIVLPSGDGDRIGRVVEGQRLLGEPLGTRAHVGTHLAHLSRVADSSGRSFHAGEVVASGRQDDLLNGEKMVSHVLLLMVRHHREQWCRDSRVHLVERRVRFADRRRGADFRNGADWLLVRSRFLAGDKNDHAEGQPGLARWSWLPPRAGLA